MTDPVPAAPAPAPAPVEKETDSTYGDGEGSLLNYGSITSSIYNFRVENERTYHAYSEPKYLIPNDEPEQDRMDLAYYAVLRMFDGKPFFAPIQKPQRIIDMGTGTGIWALDVGDQYSEAEVIGIDLSPIQPHWVAPNVEFRVDDIDAEWVFGTPPDLIHDRLCSGVAIRDWPEYLGKSYKALRPGGWVEAQEFQFMACSDDGSFPKNSAIVKYHQLGAEAFMKVGCNTVLGAQDIKAFMLDAGFINVETVELKLPLSPWNLNDKRLRKAGAFCMVQLLQGIKGLSLSAFVNVLGWSETELDIFLASVRAEWKQKSIHGYWPLFAVYGQKPEAKGKETSTA